MRQVRNSGSRCPLHLRAIQLIIGTALFFVCAECAVLMTITTASTTISTLFLLRFSSYLRRLIRLTIVRQQWNRTPATMRPELNVKRKRQIKDSLYLRKRAYERRAYAFVKVRRNYRNYSYKYKFSSMLLLALVKRGKSQHDPRWVSLSSNFARRAFALQAIYDLFTILKTKAADARRKMERREGEMRVKIEKNVRNTKI